MHSYKRKIILSAHNKYFVFLKLVRCFKKYPRMCILQMFAKIHQHFFHTLPQATKIQRCFQSNDLIILEDIFLWETVSIPQGIKVKTRFGYLKGSRKGVGYA